MKEPIVEFPRGAVSWPDRRLWAARLFALRAAVLRFIEQYPWAVGAIAVPLTIIALAGVAMLPLLFVPLLLLIGVALIVIEYYADQQTPGEYAARAAGGAPRWNLRSRMGRFRLPGSSKWPQMITEARARAEAVAAESLASAARALAADARKQADVAQSRARANQPHFEGATDHPKDV
ncbi:hypothetical protein [Mycolicibacterium gadium]|uniref:DUF3093 domain-containing protein n=1 Tax=Mycolicibacterium gadium TaxID=1794 RepID=A0ABT6GMX4_MYCGU|nr:hypothetical protein [Mycolicibacterium gadium]MDG5482812.1 hypothetical protein [Mycolicibacterium gadium]